MPTPAEGCEQCAQCGTVTVPGLHLDFILVSTIDCAGSQMWSPSQALCRQMPVRKPSYLLPLAPPCARIPNMLPSSAQLLRAATSLHQHGFCLHHDETLLGPHAMQGMRSTGCRNRRQCIAGCSLQRASLKVHWCRHPASGLLSVRQSDRHVTCLSGRMRTLSQSPVCACSCTARSGRLAAIYPSCASSVRPE